MEDLSVAYDGSSKRPQSRELQPLERDILCRLIAQTLWGTGPRAPLDEIPILESVFQAIDPRGDTGLENSDATEFNP